MQGASCLLLGPQIAQTWRAYLGMYATTNHPRQSIDEVREQTASICNLQIVHSGGASRFTFNTKT